MDLSSLLHQLTLPPSSSSSSSSSPPEKPRPPQLPPPITEVLARLQEKLIGAEDEKASDVLIGQAEQLFRTADPDWLFRPDPANQAALVAVASALIGRAALPLCEPDAPPPASGYRDVPERARPVCSALAALLVRLGRCQSEAGGGASRSLLHAVAPPCFVFAVTHLQVAPWTSPASRQAAAGLQGALLRAGRWRDPAHFLMGDEEEEEGTSRGMLGGVLDVLQPQLNKDTWQHSEAVKFVFSSTLLQVSRPALSPHLPRLLPPALLLSDHYRPENCMLGVRCVHHIVLNTPAAELRQYNRAEVLYQALYKHLYTTEASVIQLVLSCLLDLLLVLEKPPASLAPARPPRKPCRHDDVLRLLLTHMEAESKVALRRVYAAALPLYIDRMGVAVCRHLRRVERVLLGYLEVGDPPDETSRLAALTALQRTVEAAWPRMAGRVCVLLRCLLRLLLDVSSDCEPTAAARQQLMEQSRVCVALLDRCAHTQLQSLLQQVDSSCVSPDVLSCLATVTVETPR
ncbi:TELO2-interacting protein 2-like isoform X1 [Myripristis murdjan]|uniref:TELO2-interacting protein 2-like isoform X1 n=1 Tax=Myripristis murdjan TaxID=586833 RepID=UPI0011760D6E|nr:TELO2-interacting protein 2-like isoform X1 [Myripristis murdjan]XP_029915382.1 TELO2-interacting protein 2-like isoform X1 [Myripristis murdjan]